MKGSLMIRMGNFSLPRTGLSKRRASVRTLQLNIGAKDTALRILFLAS
jgi:hypothetical protein